MEIVFAVPDCNKVIDLKFGEVFCFISDVVLEYGGHFSTIGAGEPCMYCESEESFAPVALLLRTGFLFSLDDLGDKHVSRMDCELKVRRLS